MLLYPSLSTRLKYQYTSIEKIISGIGNEQLIYHPQPGKWSIHDNIAHLAKYQPVFIERTHTILNSEQPIFERYKAEDDPEFETWRAWNMNELFQRMANDRKKIVDLISNLNDTELIRIGIHKKYGKLTILQWTEFFLLHEAHHIFTIFQLANDTDINE